MAQSEERRPAPAVQATYTVTASNSAGSVTTRITLEVNSDSVWDNPKGTTGIGTLAIWAGTIYIGGRFTSVAGTGRNALAAIDASTGTLLEWNPDVALSNTSAVSCANPSLASLPPVAEVCSLAIVDGFVFAGGFHEHRWLVA